MPNIDLFNLEIDIINFSQEDDNNNFITGVKNKNITNSIISKELLSETSLNEKIEYNDKRVRLYIPVNMHSIKDNDLKFTNFIDSKNCNEADIVIRICNLLKKSTVAISELPFSLDEYDRKQRERINKNNRIFKILELSGINSNVIGDIYKSTYSRLDSFLIRKKDNNLVRIMYLSRGNSIVIILIDFYHLFATNNFQSYEAHKSKNYDIVKIIETFNNKIRR